MLRSLNLRRTRLKPNSVSLQRPMGEAVILPPPSLLTAQVGPSSDSSHLTLTVSVSSFMFFHFFLPPELLSGPNDSSSSLKPFLPSSTSPLSSICSRAGSEPPPSSPPSAQPAPGLLSSFSSSSPSSKSPPPAPVTSTPSSAPPSQTSCSQDGAPSAESEEEKAKKLLYCSLCKVAVNSLSQLEAHNAGETNTNKRPLDTSCLHLVLILQSKENHSYVLFTLKILILV